MLPVQYPVEIEDYRSIGATPVLVASGLGAVLRTISVPTLVLHASDDITVPVGNGRWLADHIEGARFAELQANTWRSPPNSDSPTKSNRFSRPTSRGGHRPGSLDRSFSDIVGSTEYVVAGGDRRWRDVLDRHDAVVTREIETYRGRLVDSTGDGALATFDGPARAVSCGCQLRNGLRPLGIDVRVGLHTGEIEVRGGDIGGSPSTSVPVSRRSLAPARYSSRALSPIASLGRVSSSQIAAYINSRASPTTDNSLQ